MSVACEKYSNAHVAMMNGKVSDDIPNLVKHLSRYSLSGSVRMADIISNPHVAVASWRNVKAAHPTNIALKPARPPASSSFLYDWLIMVAHANAVIAPAKTAGRPVPPYLRHPARIPERKRHPVVPDA